MREMEPRRWYSAGGWGGSHQPRPRLGGRALDQVCISVAWRVPLPLRCMNAAGPRVHCGWYGVRVAERYCVHRTAPLCTACPWKYPCVKPSSRKYPPELNTTRLAPEATFRPQAIVRGGWQAFVLLMSEEYGRRIRVVQLNYLACLGYCMQLLSPTTAQLLECLIGVFEFFHLRLRF